MGGLPLCARAIVIVCEDLMIVNVHSGQQRRTGRTAHRRRGVRMAELSAAVTQQTQCSRHKI